MTHLCPRHYFQHCIRRLLRYLPMCFSQARFWRLSLLPFVILAVLLAYCWIPADGRNFSSRLFATFALWPSAVLLAALVWLLDQASSNTRPFHLRLSPLPLAVCLSVYTLTTLAVARPDTLHPYLFRLLIDLPAPLQVLGMASILSSFFVVVPFRDVLCRAASQPLLTTVALVGIATPLLGRFGAPAAWAHMPWIDARLIQGLALLWGVSTDVTVGTDPTVGSFATVAARQFTVRLVRFCSAADQLRLFVPLLSAFILVGRPLLSHRKILLLLFLIGPFTFLLNATRISLIVAYASWRIHLGVDTTFMTASELHTALGGGRFLAFGGVLLYLLCRAVSRVGVSRSVSE